MAPSLLRFRKQNNRFDNEKDQERSREIDMRIRNDKKKRGQEIRVLLLGAAESGKSTIIKQMRIINDGGFKTEERKVWKNIIFHNLTDAFLYLFNIMASQNTELQDSGNMQYLPLLNKKPDIGIDEDLPSEYFDCFSDLWADAGIQLAILRAVAYGLHDNLVYFIENLGRLFQPNYLPSNQDILCAKSRTTGICETDFNIENHIYRMVDVGGQRSERRKWIKAFDGINAVIFVAAISGYDQFLEEDPNRSQMEEALMLFKEISNSPFFKLASFILFLNKIDLLHEKLKTGMSPIRRYYPDYVESITDVQAGQDYFAQMFKRLYRDPNKLLYTHFTNATDTNLLKVTMKSVQNTILQHNFSRLML